jgi:ketosteroid isomerase-like protein
MDDARTVLERLTKGLEDKDLDAVVSCWHPEVETVHLLRPDRSWRGADTFGRVQARIWESSAASHDEIISTGIVENRIYLETLTSHADGSAIPCVSILEVEDGQIRRARVYTDQPTYDGLSMDGWVKAMNEEK